MLVEFQHCPLLRSGEFRRQVHQDAELRENRVCKQPLALRDGNNNDELCIPHGARRVPPGARVRSRSALKYGHQPEKKIPGPK